MPLEYSETVRVEREQNLFKIGLIGKLKYRDPSQDYIKKGTARVPQYCHKRAHYK